MSNNTKQPPAIPNDAPCIWDLVLLDMTERDEMGLRKHGTRLQPNNGRDALVDAYQEALDLVVYLRQAFESGAIPRNAAANLDLFDAEPTRCRACLL